MNSFNFDMLSRTVGEQLPDCVLFDYNESLDRHVLMFYGSMEELTKIPIRGDFVVEGNILVGDACQVKIRKNHKDYEAEYHAYAVHIFEENIPN